MPVDYDGDRTDALFKDELPRGVAATEASEDRRSTDGGMTGERQLLARGENAYLTGVSGIAGRQHEGGLWKVELARQFLHGPIRDPLGVRENRKLVSGERPVAE